MDNQLFRRKSLDHISSPEELHDYIRVPGPRVWMLLAAVLVLLAGFIAYAGTERTGTETARRVTRRSFFTSRLLRRTP